MPPDELLAVLIQTVAREGPQAASGSASGGGFDAVLLSLLPSMGLAIVCAGARTAWNYRKPDRRPLLREVFVNLGMSIFSGGIIAPGFFMVWPVQDGYRLIGTAVASFCAEDVIRKIEGWTRTWLARPTLTPPGLPAPPQQEKETPP